MTLPHTMLRRARHGMFVRGAVTRRRYKTSFGQSVSHGLDNLVSASAVDNAVAGLAGGIAAAAGRSVIQGTDFGDNLQRALPSIIGNTIGNLVASEIENRNSGAVSAGGGSDTSENADNATVTVKDGQTAYGLAQSGGYSLDQLKAINAGVDLANLDIGQTLNVPLYNIAGQVGAALAAPLTDAERQVIANLGVDFGATGAQQVEVQQAIIDRQRFEGLANSPIGQTDAFNSLYSDFRIGLTSIDAYNSISVQALLGDSIHRINGGSYLSGVVTQDSRSNYRGYLYHDDISGQNIFANKGTDPSNANDRATDYGLGGADRLPQLDVAQRNALQLQRNGVPNLVFTGHSLGGALAILQGLRVSRPVVTFNSAPFSIALAEAYTVNFSNANALIRNYHSNNDPLTYTEINHYAFAGSVASARLIPVFGPLIAPYTDDGAGRLARIGLPPGQNIFPGGQPSITSISGPGHSAVDILDELVTQVNYTPKTYSGVPHHSGRMKVGM